MQGIIKEGGGKLVQVRVYSTNIANELPDVYDKLNVHNFCVIPKHMYGDGRGGAGSGGDCNGLSYNAETGQLSVQMSVSYGVWEEGAGWWPHSASVSSYEIWVNYVK